MKNSYDDLDSLIESTHFAKKKQHSASPKAGSETPVAYVYEKPGGGFAYELFDGKQRTAFGAEKTKDLAVKSVGNDANAVFGKAVKVTIKFEQSAGMHWRW